MAVTLATLFTLCALPAVTRAQASEASPPTVTCASVAGQRQTCAADTRKGVDLVKSNGTRACELGRTWGFTEEAIWVAEGCSGEFALGVHPQKKIIGDYVPRAGYVFYSSFLLDL